MSRSRKYAKGNINRNDYNRVVITDTAPYETPVIFSNDGYYDNLMRQESGTLQKRELIEALIKKSAQTTYTTPYRFNILKTPQSFRTLSLLHPRAQRQISLFYRKYEDLICYYCSKSRVSIRSPFRVASSYFFRASISDENKFKNASVDTADIDRRVRNPASFFAYRGFNRLYKFFDGKEYLRLEKKFRYMCTLDISKCFDSIYTHSISWAVKDVQTAKENTRASTFGNDFDQLMQRQNYNETNGICIGPEASRIFAEVILSEIDRKVERNLTHKGFFAKVHYEYRRYVDDYFIFTNDESVTESVRSAIALGLAEYKLFLNEQKIEKFNRPFQTQKSKIIDDVNATLNQFTDKLFEYESIGARSVPTPRYIWRPENLIRWIIKEVKSCCFDGNVGYEMTSNYVIATLTKRIQQIYDNLELIDKLEEPADEDRYVTCLLTIVEVIFFFYTVNPTVNSSYNVSKAIILAGVILKKRFPERLEFFLSKLFRWAMQVVNDSSVMSNIADMKATPIEIINIVLALRELSDSELFDVKTLEGKIFDLDNLDYFSAVSVLFYVRDGADYKRVRDRVFDWVVDAVDSSTRLDVDAHNAHLFLDIVACPYLPLADRGKLVRLGRKNLGLSQKGIGKADCENVARELEAHPWFVRWDKIDLLNMIVKKELSAVY